MYRTREYCRHDRGELNWGSFIIGTIFGTEMLLLVALLWYNFLRDTETTEETNNASSEPTEQQPEPDELHMQSNGHVL